FLNEVSPAATSCARAAPAEATSAATMDRSILIYFSPGSSDRALPACYFRPQCFMQMAYSLLHAPCEWFLTQALRSSRHCLQSFDCAAEAASAMQQPSS